MKDGKEALSTLREGPKTEGLGRVQQQAQEYKDQDMAKGGGRYYSSGRIPAFLAGHAAGVQENLIISKSEIIQAERERIWAEIQSKLEMCADSWRIGELDLERIIFGEQP